MVMQAAPVYRCYKAIEKEISNGSVAKDKGCCGKKANVSGDLKDICNADTGENLTDKKKDSTVTEKNTNQKDAQTSEKKDDQNSSDSGSGSNSVKTGDPAVWGLWASLFGSSGIAGAVIRRRKRK